MQQHDAANVDPFSVLTGRKVDIILSFSDRLLSSGASVLAVDVTISCALLAAYVAAAAGDASTLFEKRAREKILKHSLGCSAQGRAFLPIVVRRQVFR